MKPKPHCLGLFVSLPGIAGVLLMASIGLAGRPPAPQPCDIGMIYFFHDMLVWKMLPDGSGKTAVSGSLESPIEISRVLHAGQQWFLQLRVISGEIYPNGFARTEIFAIAADGTAVQLTNDPTIEPNNIDGSYPEMALMRWGTNSTVVDGKVSYLARRWQDGQVVDPGLYAITFDPDTLAAGFTSLAPVRVALDLPVYDHETYGLYSSAGYDWSPDGSAVVHSVATGGLAVTVVGGASQNIKDVPAGNPRWSPARQDGSSTIIYYDSPNFSIRRINPDGTGDAVFVSIVGTPTKGSHPATDYGWSPSGTWVLYTLLDMGRTGFKGSKVCRIPFEGGHGTALTSEYTWSSAIGWSSDQ
jgi:hypothetical protein